MLGASFFLSSLQFLWLSCWKRQSIFPFLTSWNYSCIVKTNEETCCLGRLAVVGYKLETDQSPDSKWWRLLDKNGPTLLASYFLSSWLSQVMGYRYWDVGCWWSQGLILFLGVPNCGFWVLFLLAGKEAESCALSSGSSGRKCLRI